MLGRLGSLPAHISPTTLLNGAQKTPPPPRTQASRERRGGAENPGVWAGCRGDEGL